MGLIMSNWIVHQGRKSEVGQEADTAGPEDTDMFCDFVQGFIKGAKETPKAFFAPLIGVWRLLKGVTDSLTLEK